MDMAHNLKVMYDERDALEAWIPEFDVGPENDREPGPYQMFSNARLKGAGWALDWLIVNGFSHAYPLIMAEVRSKEASIPDRYNVPEFGLYNVPLSAVLEHVYQTYILKRPSPALEATVVVVQRAIPLPEEVIRRTNIGDNTRLLVRVIDENTLQFSLVLSPSK
jgi:hypothetical protein